jgi:hypothetical protein
VAPPRRLDPGAAVESPHNLRRLREHF